MRKTTIHLISDSLCAKCDESQYPQQGWGHYLSDNFKDEVIINNAANAGWSAKGFLYSSKSMTGGIKIYDPEHSAWRTILNRIESGDFVIISHAINDKLRKDVTTYYQSTNGDFINVNNEFVQVDKGTGTHSYLTWESTLEEYKCVLKTFIKETREVNATPILMAPSGKITKLDDNNFNLTTQIEEYIIAMKEVATEESVILIDVYSKFTEIQKLLGYDLAVNTFAKTPKLYKRYEPYGTYPVNKDLTVLDEVHYNLFTAMFVADMFCDLLKQTDCILKDFLI